jgi:hypothetical protein
VDALDETEGGALTVENASSEELFGPHVLHRG